MRNIILITIDCLRVDYVSCINKNSPVWTHTFDQIGHRGVIFTRSFSVSSWTHPAFVAVHTSTFPTCSPNFFMLPPIPTLAEVLRENGYSTAAFISNPWLTKVHGYDRGFTEFCDTVFWKNELASLGRESLLPCHHTKGQVINRYAIDWIKTKAKDPFLVWLHYMDLHTPVRSIVERAISKIDSSYARRKAYKRVVRVVDTFVRDFMSGLEQDQLEDSYVVVTADHGQSLGEDGFYGHGRRLSDELIRIPLILSGPALTPWVSDSYVSLIDLAPTLLKLNGIDLPPMWHNGDILRGASEPIICEDIISNGKISHQQWLRQRLEIEGMRYCAVWNNLRLVYYDLFGSDDVDCEVYRIDGNTVHKKHGLSAITEDTEKLMLDGILEHIDRCKCLREELTEIKGEGEDAVSEAERSIVYERLKGLGYID